MTTPELSASDWKHLKHLHHRKNYLERKLASGQPTVDQQNIFEMHKRETLALAWVLSKFPALDHQPKPETEKTLDTE